MPGEEPLMLSVTPRTRPHLNVTRTRTRTRTGTTETQKNLGIYEITETLGTLGMVGIRMVGMYEMQGITGMFEMAEKCEIQGTEEVMTGTRGTEDMTETEGLTALKGTGTGTELGMRGKGDLTAIETEIETVTVTEDPAV
jgi:hypothetical protein